MSTFAIGDVHGNLRALNHLLLKVEADLASHDTVVFLGDIIDGYPDSKGCLDTILAFRDRCPAKVVAIMGNHEEWFLRTMKDPTRHSWLISMKGLTTIGSYSKEAEQLLRKEMQTKGPPLITEHLPLSYEEFFQRVPTEHKEFIEKMVDYHREGEAVLVYGGVSSSYKSIEEEQVQALRWGHEDFPDDYSGAEMIIYGHWSKKAILQDGRPIPYEKNNTICIDTVKHGVLTGIWVPAKRVVQSNSYLY